MSTTTSYKVTEKDGSTSYVTDEKQWDGSGHKKVEKGNTVTVYRYDTDGKITDVEEYERPRIW